MTNGRSFFTPGVEGPTTQLFQASGGGDDERELTRSQRYRRRNQQLERANSALIEEKQRLLERIGTLEAAIEFGRRHMERIRKGAM